MRGLIIAAIASLVVGISAGLVCGILLMRFAGPDPGLPPPPMRTFVRRIVGPPGAPAEPRLLGALEGELDLTAQQRARIVEILEQARVEHAAARESVRMRIERALTERQRARWRELEDRYQRSWQRRDGRRLPFDGPP